MYLNIYIELIHKCYMFVSSTHLSYIATRCLRACLFVCLRPISSGTAGPIWLYFFLLAPSWSRDGFRPKKFRIRDPDFPEIRKNPDFRVFLTNLAEIYR